MRKPNPEDTRVRPEFAAAVFGSLAAIILLFTLTGPASLYKYVAGFAWTGSLLALAIRGFLNEERNAFAPVEDTTTNMVPVLLAATGLLALLESERAPGVLLLVLAVGWTFAAPSWRPLWGSKPIRFVGNVSQIVQGLLTLAAIATLIWSWLAN